MLSRGEAADGGYLLLEGSLSVYVAQKVCVCVMGGGGWGVGLELEVGWFWAKGLCVACSCQRVTCYKAIIATVGQHVTQGLAAQEMSQVINSFKCAVVSIQILEN